MQIGERKKRQGFMLAYPFEEKRLNKWGFPVLVQPKLDGVRCGLDFSPSGEILLRSSTQEIITSVPHINAEIEEYCASLSCPTPMLDGELYVHGKGFEEIYSITSRTKNFHPNFDQIQFHVFDLMLEQMAQADRISHLLDFTAGLSPSSPIRTVQNKLAYSFADIWNLYQQFISEGYEGIIVRDLNAPYIKRRSTQVMKFKPKKDDWYTVIGSVEEVDKYGNSKGRLGALICLGSTGDTFTVGSGLTDKLRSELWGQDLKGWLCRVQYQHITPGKGVPRFPVFMELSHPDQALGTLELNGNAD
jgi:ATP-dependent DNA ligase